MYVEQKVFVLRAYYRHHAHVTNFPPIPRTGFTGFKVPTLFGLMRRDAVLLTRIILGRTLNLVTRQFPPPQSLYVNPRIAALAMDASSGGTKKSLWR